MSTDHEAAQHEAATVAYRKLADIIQKSNNADAIVKAATVVARLGESHRTASVVEHRHTGSVPYVHQHEAA